MVTNPPMVSVVIPTRNSAATLELCLNSLRAQNYPPERLELLVLDGYSTDRTVEIAERFGAKILNNPKITGEAGKALGVKLARGDLILLLDSDNVIPESDWLASMVKPFAQQKVVASEPLFYHYSRDQPAIVRYCALIGADDPVAVYLGFYGRFSHLTCRWTDIPIRTQDRQEYLEIDLGQDTFPTMGANGFFVRSWAAKKIVTGDYLFDVDIVHDLRVLGDLRVARVKRELLHLYATSLNQYLRKTYRRTRDYYYYHRLGARKYGWTQFDRLRLLWLLLGVMTGIPLLLDAVRSCRRKPDIAWILNWPLAALSVFTYALKEATSGFYLLRTVRTKNDRT